MRAEEDDIVLSERITGMLLAVIRTPYIERIGHKAGPMARWMLRGRRTKRLMRIIYALKSGWQIKRASLDETGKREYWQAGKSVAGIRSVETAEENLRRYAAAARSVAK